jgi:hypothetical protein
VYRVRTSVMVREKRAASSRAFDSTRARVVRAL